MKVLLATDGSQHSLDAVEAFVSRFAWFRQPPAIELCHVHPAIPYGRAAAWAGKEAVERYYAEESDAALKPAADLLAARGVAFQAVKLVGEAGHELVRHAQSAGCDLIAMGTHGTGAMTNLVMGSVATKVIASSKVPVLLLK
ncbi:MAG TPA: universal stress protein [Casimicrobiaceae bacterium]|nr:universal stress protein [Casimicrobiaceae bacterium]